MVSKGLPNTLGTAMGTAARVSTVATTHGGSKRTAMAMEKPAFPTVVPHTTGVSTTTTANPCYTGDVPGETPLGVPSTCLAGGGATGHGTLRVTCPGAVCGAPLNEVGSGLLATAYLLLDVKEFAI